jgi:hypothetical protein
MAEVAVPQLLPMRLLLLGLSLGLALVSGEPQPVLSGPHASSSAFTPQASASSAARDSAPSAADSTSIRFAVIGDWGSGSRRQYETARQLWSQYQRFPFEFVLTVGDNIYGDEGPADMHRKFALPYEPIIKAKIPFHATLGNHDERSQVNYPPFNMNGRAYYTFTHGTVQFFALDSTLLTQSQLRWFEDEISRSRAPWRIAYFHHPIYSSGLRHGPLLVLRAALEPILSTFGVRVVFTGHEHFYERLHPRYGVYPFITGSAGQLRRGGIRDGSEIMAAGFDQDNAFMLVEIAGDTLRFEAVSRTGEIVDSGTIPRIDR